MSALNRNISFFNHLMDTANPDNRGTFLQIVTSAKLEKQYGPNIERIRRTTDKAEREKLKKRQPAFCPSGLFSYRNGSGLAEHSGLMAFDIDPKGNPFLNHETAPDVRDMIAGLQEVAYCALSVSGLGIWGVVPIAFPERHSEHFAALEADFARLNYVIDSSCKNVDRLRYWSYDPDAYFNDNATVYTSLKSIQDTYVPSQSVYFEGLEFEQKKVEAILKQLERNRIDITDGGNGYNIWFSIGCGFAGIFGENGRDFFHRVSQFHPEYGTAKTDLQFNNCLKWRGISRADLHTFFAHAKLKGITYKEHLNG